MSLFDNCYPFSDSQKMLLTNRPLERSWKQHWHFPLPIDDMYTLICLPVKINLQSLALYIYCHHQQSNWGSLGPHGHHGHHCNHDLQGDHGHQCQQGQHGHQGNPSLVYWTFIFP